MNTRLRVYGCCAVYLCAAICLFAASLPAGAQDHPPFQAGAAASNITPPLGSPIVGGWEPIPARNVHDELYAKCLVLDDGSTRLAFVLCDNVGIPREVFDAARTIVEEETGIPADHLLMASTHTHSAASARGPSKVLIEDELTDYQQFIARRIGDGVRRAIVNLEPARVAWGSVDEPSEVFNRRWHMTDPEQLTNPFGGVDQVRMNPPRAAASLVRPAGPIDPEISFISVQSLDGRPISLLANYSLHYVGGVRSGDISADYFAMFAERIEELLGAEKQDPPFVGILSNGTSGDINNINFRERSPRYEPYEKMRLVGDLVARRVYEALQQVEHRDHVSLAAEMTELTLAVRKPDEALRAWLEEMRSKPEDAQPAHSRERIYVDRITRILDAPDEIDVPLQVFRIGDLAVTAIPFETFVEIGLALKEQSPFEDTFTIELANGSFGYLPTPEQHELGGYETWLGTNYVEFEASERIEETLLEMLKSLAGQ